MVLPCIEVYEVRKAYFPAHGYCNRWLQLQVEYLFIVMGTASLRPLTILPQICTVWCTKLRKRFIAIMEVFHCFTVAIGLVDDASNYNEDKRSAVAARAFKTRWLSSESTVRAGSEILAIWAPLKQWSENKNVAMCVVSLRLTKTKK